MSVPPNEEALTNQKIKEDWLAALDGLVKQLKEWTRPQHGASCPCCTPVCDIIETIIELDEEHIGSYSAPMLYLKTENTLIELKPAGRFAIGAIGRVDMSNHGRRYSLLYSSRRGWVCMENRQSLTKSLFLELLADLAQKQSGSNLH
ncbi:MAG: hypothetical protein PHP51_08450 [Desulfotomaculaceae bacterium]|nr:hypothetical protein [Desulfotomaculaceae bacterium]MDD4767348.1 hypothetical protein [Desulfotomaculaceae bacterium]